MCAFQNTQSDLVTCNPRKHPSWRYIWVFGSCFFSIAVTRYPTFPGHKRTPASLRNVAPASQNKLRHYIRYNPVKKRLSTNTSDRGARTCRVHDLALFRGHSKWPSLKKYDSGIASSRGKIHSSMDSIPFGRGALPPSHTTSIIAIEGNLQQS